jgi:hypothetical protein
MRLWVGACPEWQAFIEKTDEWEVIGEEYTPSTDT